MDEHLIMEDGSLVWTCKDVLQHQNDKMIPLRYVKLLLSLLCLIYLVCFGVLQYDFLLYTTIMELFKRILMTSDLQPI